MTTKHLGIWIRVDRDPATVWAALTQKQQLERWLGSEVELDAREGGRLHLVSGTPLISGDHIVRGAKPEQSLDIEWTIDGQPTRVSFALAPEGDATKVSFECRYPAEHAFAVDPAIDDPGHLFAELWGYVLGLLKTYIELGSARPLLAPDRAPDKAITHVVEIAASPARVFAAIDDPDEIKQWNKFAVAPKNDRRVGGRYSFGWKSEEAGTDGPGEIVEYEPGHRITYRWHGQPPMLVSWTVEPVPGSDSATRLTLVHSGFAIDRNLLVGWNLGWGGFMQKLSMWLERGAAPNWMGM